MQSLQGFSDIQIGKKASFFDWRLRLRKGGTITALTRFPAGVRIYFSDGSSCLEQELDCESDALKALKGTST